MYKDYNFYDPKDMGKQELTNNASFIEDASVMLQDREGYTEEDLETPDQIYDAYMEHFRFFDVNEVTAIKDLNHVMSGTTEQKARYGRLLNAYETSEGESFFDEDISVGLRKAGDYAEGLVSAPSTLASVFTGGYAKVAAKTGIEATKFGIKRVLKEIMKAGVKGAAIEGTIGLGQGAVKETTRVASGIKKDFDSSVPFIEAGLAATGGFVLTGLARGLTLPSEIKSIRLQERATGAIKLRESNAKTKTDDILKDTSEEQLKEINTNLVEVTQPLKGDKTVKKFPLDPTKVKMGEDLKKGLSTSETLTSTLSEEVRRNITAAVLRVGKEVVDQQPGERITAAIYRAMDSNKLDMSKLQKVLDEHNITLDQFSLIYKADVSAAGRLLGEKGRIARIFGSESLLNNTEYKAVKDVLNQVDALDKAGISKISAKETADQLNANPLLIPYRFVQDFDQARIALMTVQPKTSARNTINGGFRIMTDAVTRSMDNALSNALPIATLGIKGKFKNPFDGSFDVVKFMFNPYEGDLIKKVFTESFPNESSRLFMKNADLEARSGGDGIMTTLGRKLNFLNTASDNIFKRAVLGASLQRGINDANLIISKEARESIIKQRLIQRLGPDYRSSPDYTVTVKKITKELSKQKKHTLATVFEAGAFNKLDDTILTKSITNAYDFAYQSQFKQYGKLGSDIARGTIAAQRKLPFVISIFLPFPKFVASQLKFVYEHAPIIGMLPAEKIPNPLSVVKGKKVPYEFKDRIAKQLMTASLSYVAYQWRAKQGETNHWYEYRGSDGNLVDGRAMYGPFSMWMLYADIMYRSGYFSGKENQLPTKSWGRYAKDVLQAVAGSTFRSGLGIYTLDKLLTDLSNSAEGETGETTDRIVGEILGNIAKTLTIPIAFVKDAYSQFDIKSSYIPETKSGETNLIAIAMARANSNIPDIGPNTPFLGKDGYGSISSVANALDLKYDKPARSAFITGPLKAINPLIGQGTGEMVRPPKNAYQREIGRLNMNEYEIYRKHPNERVNTLTKFYLSVKGSEINLNERMAQVIRTKKYKSYSYKRKRSSLRADSQKFIRAARERAIEEVKLESSNAGDKYTKIDMQKWISLNQRDKESVNAYLATQLKQYGFENFTSVSSDAGRMVRMGESETSILVLANKVATKIKEGVLGGLK